MSIVLAFLITFGQAVPCPIERASFMSGAARWGHLQLGMSQSEVVALVGHPLNLERDDTSGRHARLSFDGQSIVLTFHMAGEDVTLEGITLIRGADDPDRCWAPDALAKQVRASFPDAKYRPSRHAPELTESENEFPMFSVGGSDDTVILLKPTQGSIFIGKERMLD